MASFQLRTDLLCPVASSQMGGRLDDFVSPSEENFNGKYLDGPCCQLNKNHTYFTRKI